MGTKEGAGRHVRWLYILWVFLLSHIACAQSTNALWNGSEGVIGVWIYPTSGDCPEIRRRAAPFVFAAHSDGGTYLVSQLQYCFQLPEHAGTKIARCKSGKVHFTLDTASQRYSGEYSFILSDGSKRAGEFVAQFCPKEGQSPDVLPEKSIVTTGLVDPNGAASSKLFGAAGICRKSGKSITALAQ